MSDPVATQEKMMPGSSKATATIDGSLWLAVVAIAVAFLSYGKQGGNERAVDLKQTQQDEQMRQRLGQQDQVIRDLQTEVQLLRQDVADLRIEARSKLQPRARPK